MEKSELCLEELALLDQQMEALREEFKKNSSANAVVAMLAEFHLERIARLRTYQLALPERTLEENIPRMRTALRMLGDLTTMILGHTDALLNCRGGPEVISIQMLEAWAEGNPARQELLHKYLEAKAASLRSPARKATRRRSTKPRD